VTRQVIETAQHFMLRVACGLAEDDSLRLAGEVTALYDLMSRLGCLPLQFARDLRGEGCPA
jgi:ribonucleoside-diphosphate reductase alpha chain